MYIKENELFKVILTDKRQIKLWENKYDISIISNKEFEIHWKFLKTKAGFRKKSIILKCDDCKEEFSKMIQNLDENIDYNLCKSCTHKGERSHMYGKVGDKHPNYGKKIESITGDKNPAKRQEVREKISNTNKGKVFRFNYNHTEETKEKIRKSNLGRVVSQETKDLLRNLNINKKHTQETKDKIRIATFGKKKPRKNQSVYIDLRKNHLYRQWRKKIIERDSYTCQFCNDKNSKLEVHHILGVSTNKDLVCEDTNGITLCKSCHKAFHSIHGKKDFINILLIMDKNVITI